MPTARTPRAHTVGLLLTALLAAVSGLATGCGEPPGLHAAQQDWPPRRTSSPMATPTTPPASPTALPSLPSTPTPPFPEYAAVDCQGRPTGAQVLSLLRRSGEPLPGGTAVRVQSPPRCAGDWQYTIVAVTGREPLQVVTRGPSGSLELVTAGTDVCNAPVRVAAPPGIRTLACDGGTAPSGGL